MHFRQTAGRILGVDPDGILIGNGSDDILTIVTRAFVPEGGLVVSPTPSYLLYRTLADLQGARFQTVSLHRRLEPARSVAARKGASHLPRQSEFAFGNNGESAGRLERLAERVERAARRR